MDFFSNEYRNSLINEHKIVSASISRLTDRFRFYAPTHTAEICTAAVTSLKRQKVELEVKIDVLEEFLNG